MCGELGDVFPEEGGVSIRISPLLRPGGGTGNNGLRGVLGGDWLEGRKREAAAVDFRDRCRGHTFAPTGKKKRAYRVTSRRRCKASWDGKQLSF